MGLRTSEQLLELFKERKRIQEKKQLQKQKQKQEQKQLLLQVRKERQKRLKQAEQQQLTAKAETTIEITIAIPTDYSDDENLFQTREELMAWEQEHWPCINWSKFDQVVNDTKKMIGLICQDIPKL